MKMIVLAAGLASALMLAGCETTGSTGGPGAKVTEVIAQVQARTKQVCGYLPLAKTVAAIFDTGAIRDAISIGDAICNAVTINPKAEGPGGRRKPTVAGVVVQGSFVKR